MTPAHTLHPTVPNNSTHYYSPRKISDLSHHKQVLSLFCRVAVHSTGRFTRLPVRSHDALVKNTIVVSTQVVASCGMSTSYGR